MLKPSARSNEGALLGLSMTTATSHFVVAPERVHDRQNTLALRSTLLDGGQTLIVIYVYSNIGYIVAKGFPNGS